MSITENAVVRIVIDDREARAQLAAFERAKQQALAVPSSPGSGGGPAGQVGSQALGRSAALVGATAPATRSGVPVHIGGAQFPAGAVAYHDITRAMQALPQGTPAGQVMGLARQYAGGAGGQTAERAGEQIVQREVEGLRRGMARGAQQAASQAGAGATTAAAQAVGGGRPMFGGVLSGTSPLLSLGAFSFSAMALATGAVGAVSNLVGTGSDVYREARGVTAAERVLEDRRQLALRQIGEDVEPARTVWENITTRGLEAAAYGVGLATGQAPPPPAPGQPAAPDLRAAITGAIAEGWRVLAASQASPAGGGPIQALARGAVGMAGFLTAVEQRGPLGPTALEGYQETQARTAIDIGRRDLRDQAAAIARSQRDFAADQRREQAQLERTFERQQADLGRQYARGERDIGINQARARRDIGVSQMDAYADLATQQGYGRADIDRGYQRSVRGAVLGEILPGGLTGALIGAAIQRQDALADLDTGGARQAAQIGLSGSRALRDMGTRGGDMLDDLARGRNDAAADMQTAFERAQADLSENQKLAADRFNTNVDLVITKLNDQWAALDLVEKKLGIAANDYVALAKAQEDYRKSLRIGGESITEIAGWTRRTLTE